MTLLTGSALSQIIVIAASPILTRLFSPEIFGSSALFLSICSILLIFTTLRYELPIIQTQDNQNALSLVMLSILTSISFFIIFELLIIIFINNIKILELNNNFNNLLPLLPLYVLLSNIHRIIVNYMNKNKFYKIISVNQIVQSFFKVISKVIFGLLVIPFNGIILGNVIGQFLSTSLIVIRFFRLKIDKAIIIKSFKKIKHNAYYYKNFPKYILLSDSVNTFALQSPFLLIGYLFSIKDLGFLSLAYSVSSVPLNFIGTSLSRVFRQQAADDFNKTGRCDELFLQMLNKLILYLIFPFLLLFFTAPFLFKIVFGANWIISGHMVQILTAMFFCQFIARILSYMYILTNHQKENLLLQIILLVLTISSFIMGYIIFNNIYMCLILYSISYSALYIYMIYKSYIFSKGLIT
tara:strand:+ start:3720 stop:4949 length:1230 start_codon:yes stop_codon:yes gene_type:complete